MSLEAYLKQNSPSLIHFSIPDYLRTVRSGNITLINYFKTSGLSILWQGALGGAVWATTFGQRHGYRKTGKKLFTAAQIKEMESATYEDGWKMPAAWKDKMAEEKYGMIPQYAIRGVAIRGALGLYYFNVFEKLRAAYDSENKAKAAANATSVIPRGLNVPAGLIGSGESSVIPEARSYSGMMVPSYMK